MKRKESNDDNQPERDLRSGCGAADEFSLVSYTDMKLHTILKTHVFTGHTPSATSASP